MIYKTFEEWKAGHWLEDGELRTEAYKEDELLLVEMGWKYGFDAGKQQTKPLSDEEIENIWHELYPLDSNNYWEDNRKGLCQLRFARAIMERCGIISGTDK